MSAKKAPERTLDIRGHLKKLTRSQRAECRAFAKTLHVPVASLARMYGTSAPVITRVINNEFKFKDNLDSDEEHITSDVSPDLLEVMDGLNDLIRTYKEKQNLSLSCSSVHLAEEAGSAGQMGRPSGEYSQVNLERFMLDAIRTAQIGSSPEFSSSTDTVLNPGLLSALVVRKRKPDVGEGMLENISAPAKVAKTERSDVVPMRRPGAAPDLTQAAVPSARLPRSKSIYKWPIGGVSSTQPGDAPAASLRKTRHESPEIIEIPSDSESSSFTPGSQPVDKPETTTALLPTGTTLYKYPSSATSLPAPAALLKENSDSDIVSFLVSQGRDLSRLLPLFIELGIKDKEGIRLLRNMPREESKEWFDELVGQGKLTPLEARALLCTLHG